MNIFRTFIEAADVSPVALDIPTKAAPIQQSPANAIKTIEILRIMSRSPKSNINTDIAALSLQPTVTTSTHTGRDTMAILSDELYACKIFKFGIDYPLYSR